MLNLLDIVPGTGKNEGNFVFDNLGEPFLYALIGFLIVFLGIVLIITIIWLVGLLMRKTDNFAFLSEKGRKDSKKHKEEEPIAPAPAVQQDAEADTADASCEIPDEVKAAIIAAIMAYYETSQPKCEFTVKRIRRI